jgi:fructosamine-3-kinase
MCLHIYVSYNPLQKGFKKKNETHNIYWISLMANALNHNIYTKIYNAKHDRIITNSALYLKGN